MDLEKKDWAIIILAVLAVASIAGNGVLLFTGPEQAPPDLGITLILGTMEGPADLDPMDAWDSASSDVHDQVCEGLFGYDLEDPNLAIVPVLAADFGTWGTNGLGQPTYTVDIRTDVWFHDGTKFDATAVKWNFDRYSGLMDLHLAKAHELYEYYDPDLLVNVTTMEYGGFVKIINATNVVDADTVEFVLNTPGPYGPFEATLCFNAAYILSPTATPLTEVLDTATGDLVGTGPFTYEGYEAGVEVTFKAWDYYYRPRAKIDTLIYSVINDAQIRNNALLSGDIDILPAPMPSMLSTFDADPDIDLIVAGQTLGISYLGMNSYWINTTFRKAISYAINYTFIKQELLEDQAVRMGSPIPEGITYANWSNNYATFDVPTARTYMQSMGFGVGLDTAFPGTDEAAWSAASFATFNYTYNIGNSVRENIYVLLDDNLDHIGIDVVDAGTTWAQFILSLYELAGLHRDLVQMYWLGWIPDYNDPSNYINPLFTNRSVASNGAKYNGYASALEAGRNENDLMDNVQMLMETALLTPDTDPNRQVYYNRIQELLVEEDMPWAYGYVGINNDCWKKEVKGFPSNPMGRYYFYPCYWEDLYNP
jgi:peptide/nickel transport system substrate-binding protein